MTFFKGFRFGAFNQGPETVKIGMYIPDALFSTKESRLLAFRIIKLQ